MTDEQRSQRAEGTANYRQDFRRAVLGPDAPSPLLFVYGTLLPGQRAHSLLKDRAEDWRSATTAGLLYAFPGGYPGLLVTSGHAVRGKLCRLRDPEPTFARLDAFEGDEYARVMRPVYTESGLVQAWCYALVDGVLTAAHPLIESGDWVSHTSG